MHNSVQQMIYAKRTSNKINFWGIYYYILSKFITSSLFLWNATQVSHKNEYKDVKIELQVYPGKNSMMF